jgi:hypothetical protein
MHKYVNDIEIFPEESDRIWKQAGFAHFKAGIHKPRPWVAMATEFFTVTPNICRFSV